MRYECLKNRLTAYLETSLKNSIIIHASFIKGNKMPKPYDKV